MDAYSLIVAPDHVDCLLGRVDAPGQDGGVLEWNGRQLRLVHEQCGRNGGTAWFIYGDVGLSKPEVISRAVQWSENSQHPRRPVLRA